MAAEPETITVVLVTRGRPRELERCLLSLKAAAASAPLRILLAANGASDPGLEVAFRLAPELGPLLEPPLMIESPVTPAAARNRLLERVRDGWVFFIDDDAYVEPDFFARFARSLQRHPGAAAIGGPNLTPPGSRGFQVASGLALSSRLATFLSSARYRARGAARPSTENELVLCNLFARAGALGASPFPESFPCGEENWLLFRLKSRGLELIHDPELAVFHDRRDTPARLALQVYRYGEGRARQLWKAPGYPHPARWLPTLCLLYTVFAAVRSAVTGRADRAWLALFGAYVLLCLGAAIKLAVRDQRGPGILIATAFAFPLIHVSYALGFLKGSLRALRGGELR